MFGSPLSGSVPGGAVDRQAAMTAQGNSMSPPPVRLTQMEDSLSRLANATEVLAKTCAELEQRLMPLVRVEPESAVKPMARQTMVPVAEVIASRADTIEYVTERLASLLGRLEL